ncbi:hypothetical protein GQR58_015635 [Nymphon striatum]|nr:hypothetical protein GQR58_015635 [Nymphon striatum]
MDLTGIPVPKMDWEASNLPEEFRKFKQHVELIVNGPLNDKEEGVKCTYFMLWIGDRGREIFNTWSVSSADAKILNTYYTKFQAYVQPKLNPIFARYKFNNEMQKDQSIEQFVTKLKILGKDCKFQDVDEMVRDRIVFGTSHNKVREMLINEGEQLNLDKAVQIAQQYEYAQLQLKSMTPITATALIDVNTVTEAGYGQRQRQYQQNKYNKPSQVFRRRNGTSSNTSSSSNSDKCAKCGYGHYLSSKCPAQGKRCNKCNRWNHFANMCPSNIRVNAIDTQTCEGEYEFESEPSFMIDSVHSDNFESVDQAFAQILIKHMSNNREKSINFKLDTGSQINIMPLSIYTQMGLHVDMLVPPDRMIYAYGNHSLKSIGCCKLQCAYKNRKPLIADFYIIDTNNCPLLCLTSCISLGLIKVSYSVNTQVAENTANMLTPGGSLWKYRKVFEGIGCLPGDCKIHIDQKAIPIIHPPRRVPYALKNKFKAELDRMSKLNVIEEVTQPTDWVNSVVLVTKPKTGELRVCLDPKDLNKAILRPHHPMRSLEDILPALNEAQYFTKLDARSGYWAIKLDEQSSLLTTFNTPFGRYKFKRLPFGLKCSQDDFQHKTTYRRNRRHILRLHMPIEHQHSFTKQPTSEDSSSIQLEELQNQPETTEDRPDSNPPEVSAKDHFDSDLNSRLDSDLNSRLDSDSYVTRFGRLVRPKVFKSM